MALSGPPARKVREAGPGFSAAHPCTVEKCSTSCRAPCGPSRPSLTAAQGPRTAGGPILARTRCGGGVAKERHGGLRAFRRVRAERARFVGPLCGGETETTGRVSGHRQEADAFSTVHGRAAEKPGSGSRTCRPGMGGKRQAGWPLFWLLFSGQTEKSDSRAEGARNALDLKGAEQAGTRALSTSGCPDGEREGSFPGWRRGKPGLEA